LKTSSLPMKYMIRAKFEVRGVVEKHDVVGAIFGQTEGLLPPELDLRELLKTGKIGRITVELKSEKDRTFGKIEVPSSLDRVPTAIIAAAIESVDRVGPCNARIRVERIVDIRQEKRERIVRRAVEILKDWVSREEWDADRIIEMVSSALRAPKAVKYGPEGLTAGPGVEKSDTVIIVEGRADVLNLLKYGYENVIAMEGVKVPETVIKLCEEKEATAFLDGDRGGDLILKELLQVADIKWVARAPRGKEVEELTGEEVERALKAKVSVKELKLLRKISEMAPSIRETLEAVLLDEDGNEVSKIPVSELVDTLKQVENVYAAAFDGIITRRLVDTALERGVKVLVGERIGEGVRPRKRIKVATFQSLERGLYGVEEESRGG